MYLSQRWVYNKHLSSSKVEQEEREQLIMKETESEADSVEKETH